MKLLLLFLLVWALVTFASVEKCKVTDTVLHEGEGEKLIRYEGQTTLTEAASCIKFNLKAMPGQKLKNITIKTDKGNIHCIHKNDGSAECNIDTDGNGRAVTAVVVGVATAVSLIVTGISEGTAIVDWISDTFFSAAGSLHSDTFFFYLLLSFFAMFVANKLG